VLPIKLIKSSFEILPALPVPSIFDISMLFSSTIFLTDGDKSLLVFGGIYFFSWVLLILASAKVSRTKVSLIFSSLTSSTRVKVFCLLEIFFSFFFIVFLATIFSSFALGGI